MLQGIAVSQGIGLGRVMLLKEQNLAYDCERAVDIPTELERIRQATETFCRNTAYQAELLCQSAGYENSQILESHIDMISDPVLREEIGDLIRAGLCAEDALKETCDRYIAAFSESNDELTRLRAVDIRDMRTALLCILLGVEAIDLCHAPQNTVLVARELSPSVMASIDRDNIVAIITETGGQASHAAILARALGIPAICGTAGATAALAEGSFVIVDGSRGEIICAPAENDIANYTQRREAFLAQRKQMEYFRDRATLSAEGEPYALLANITLPCGAASAVGAGAEGVGLFRTEYLFMNRKAPPDETEQYTAYCQVLQSAAGKPVTIRTLDIGGDKTLPCLPYDREDNPFLGLRGIRWCLAHQEVFLTQLRALLRAGENQNLRLLFPMVSTLEELRQAKGLLAQASEQLDSEGVPHAKNLPAGIMIETPSAVLMADCLAAESDFFSIGTNDLTGYLMACDRGNPRVSEMYSALQPALLRSLRHVIRCGKDRGIPVCICGEAASDPRLIPLLMAFGVNSFSVSPSMILSVRSAVARWGRAETERLAELALQMGTEREIAEFLSKAVAC